MTPKAIVIVEDDPNIAELMKETLGEVPGYAAVAVGNGADALETVAQVKADLVILDHDLPGLSGLEVHDQLKARLGEAMPPTLVVSARPPVAELRARGLDPLRKPFDLEELHRRVAALLGD